MLWFMFGRSAVEAPNVLNEFAKKNNYRKIPLNYINFDNLSRDHQIIKAWKLNHGLYLAGNNFITSNEIILGFNGVLSISIHSVKPIIYEVVAESREKPESPWIKLRDTYPMFDSLTKDESSNNISETDTYILFPIAEVTYTGLSIIESNNEEKTFTNKDYIDYGQLFSRKRLSGGKLIIRNFANAKPTQVIHLKLHLVWALDAIYSQKENPFKDATNFDFPMIETTNQKILKTPKDLNEWIKRIYDDNLVEIVSYEEVVPIFTFLENVYYTYNSESFINRLVPGISNKHKEITFENWIGDIDILSKNLVTWVYKFHLNRGMSVDQFGISLPNKHAFTFTQSPIITENNDHYLQCIQPKTCIEEILLRSNIIYNLDSIPFVMYNDDNNAELIEKIIYLFLCNERIKISLDKCVMPLPGFKKAVEGAINNSKPYKALQEVFNDFGYFLPKAIFLGNQLKEILLKRTNMQSNKSFIASFQASSQSDIDKILEQHALKDLDFNYLLTSNGQIIKLNQIFNWFVEYGNDYENFKKIRMEQIIPLYKILDYKLQKNVEIILKNRLDTRILLTGIKNFNVEKGCNKTYFRINFGKLSALDNNSYNVFGLVYDDKDARSESCAVRFDLFDCYGFSAFISFKDNIAKSIDEWYVIWMVIGKPSLLGTFSTKHRESNTAFHTTRVNLKECNENIVNVSLPFTLTKNCVASFSASYLPSNNPPKLNFRLLKWSKDTLKLKIIRIINEKDSGQYHLSSFNLNTCIIYPCNVVDFKTDIGKKSVIYGLFGDNLFTNDYDQSIDLDCYKNVYLNYLIENFSAKHTKYLGSNSFGYWTEAVLENNDSQLLIKHIIKRRLLTLIQGHDSDIPIEAYFLQEVSHKNLVRYVDVVEKENIFFLITKIDHNHWETLHSYLNRNGPLSENQAKNIFKQTIECISSIYKHGFFNLQLNDKNILISESLQVKLFDFEHLTLYEESNEDLVYNIQCEDHYGIAYASPEMIAGHKYDPELSDLWSLGILLYVMLHAHIPFESPFDTLVETLAIQKITSKECATILYRLLAKKPHFRGTFKGLLNYPWIGVENFLKRRILKNNIKENSAESIATEGPNTNDKIIQEIDYLIKRSSINEHLSLQWAPLNSLGDFQLIGKGEFRSVYLATCPNSFMSAQALTNSQFYEPKTSNKVVLKECSSIHEHDNLMNFLNEIKNHSEVNGFWGVIDFYGITYGHKHDDVKMILHYANKLDLNQYLSMNFHSMNWKEKLSILLDIAVGLYQIHNKVLTMLATGRYLYEGKTRKEILLKINNNDKLCFDESMPIFYQDMIYACCNLEPLNRPDARKLVNEILDWRLNKIHNFANEKTSFIHFDKLEKCQRIVHIEEAVLHSKSEAIETIQHSHSEVIDTMQYSKSETIEKTQFSEVVKTKSAVNDENDSKSEITRHEKESDSIQDNLQKATNEEVMPYII
ncbi:Serine/threonine protein kinase [Gigaspora margarita]|uniref:Serine/threonine protein kinase n=1 Tax=Gigaspora margarita TaxID=4874 RepID=A0A8H3WX76_GIGMA|nr:Serine/threonine protein kinase [Gigaspora margarita]